MIKRRLYVAWLAASILLLAACGGTTSSTTNSSAPRASGTPATGSAAPQHITLLLPFLVEGYDAAFYLGIKKGIYAKAGIDLKVLPGKGSASTVVQVGHGNYPFGLADAPTVVIASAKGVSVKMVAGYFQKSPDGIIVLAKSHIRKPADLIGKRVAYNPGGITVNLFKAFMAANHLDPNKVIQVGMAPSALVTSLADGKVNGIGGFGTSDIPQLEAKGIKATELYYADWGVPLLSDGLIVNADYAKAHPGVVRRMVQATDEAWAYTAQHPDAAVAAMKAAISKVPPNVGASLRLSLTLLHSANTQGKPAGWMSPKDWQITLENLKKYVGLKKIKPAGDYYTNAFIGSGK